MFALDLDVILVGGPTRTALAFELLQDLRDLRCAAAKTADHSYDFSSLAFLDSNPQTLLLRADIGGDGRWARTLGDRLTTMLALNGSFKRSSIKQSHGKSLLLHPIARLNRDYAHTHAGYVS